MPTTTFNVGDVVDEACENAGLDPAALTHRHLASISRSLELLFIDLENEGANAEFRQETRTYTLSQNVGGVVLDSDVLDVTQAAVLMNLDGAGPKPYPLGRTRREDFMLLSFPTQVGAPSIYWITKSIRGNGNTEQLPTGITAPPASSDTPVLVIWPQSNLAGVTSVSCTVLRQHAAPGGLADTLDTRRTWLPTITAGLAAKIALKWNPEQYAILDGIFQQKLQERDADEDHHPVVIAYRGFGYGRGRRH